ncbi:IEC3 subunit of the Ino80 complex chromatin re-modelling [Aspergillus parasiticus SU-1]|uniref:IEC3 subunit of the Ino80 complex, chromatin re-modelling-domain-containing protein n=3 Tax=Aspergillus subgen. Circumdati TaxID=2720871 RepID=A0A5N6D7A2_ASPPA|nr:IEC3 subunit of the Ino80 complex, chromatin re-modelling-domain-containing protein [Aspergillus parasiticus]KAE8306312.1 IEC3 subunit of the Ino80 complex, chromatin re-modelling-domain-containing protein [Aspergillus transmontanensis]KJK67694.1 IEC3 subunit of the Ino80 complex chromatin re-modelling [Aspergillus parasiticus SU-1]
MSQDADEAQSVAESLPDAPAGAPTKQSYRSFKKKFAKLKVKFELGMRESESLIREELRIQDLSKRIQEQNDQLLEALLEFNDSIYISPDLRYDLNAPGDDLFPPTPQRELSPSHNDPSVASSMLRNAKTDLALGLMKVEHYCDLENSVKRNEVFAPRMRYTSLITIPHTLPQPEENQSENIISEHSLGFFTPEHENEYYLATDAKLGDTSALMQLNDIPEKLSFIEREREAALRNPISVYNWLRRNQPHIFLQDNENASEKSASRPSNLRTSKKAALSQSRKDEDLHDDDSILMDTGHGSGGSKGKRKREEDVGNKSKGGSSNRSSRKKKDDGSSNVVKRSSKRTSGVGA